MMMNQLNYDYYAWLISQIKVGSSRDYNDLFERMHNTKFVWIIPNDDNRMHDGLDLRYEFVNGFLHVSRKEIEDFHESQGNASFLEVLIGLSRRVAFTAGGDEKAWAWRLIKNIRLHKMSDPFTDEKANRVDEILEMVIWRTYERNGRGGFFPLKNDPDDQTKVEIWYQMNKYVNEMNGP